MNRINPLYIGALLIMVLALSIYSLGSAKKSLNEEKESFKEIQKIANELSSLKKAYSNKKMNERAIRRLLAHSYLKSAAIDAEYQKNTLKLKSKSMDKKALDFLMGKLLNSTYNITKMTVKRLSEQKASLELEIKW
ncbi:hypothetical protein FJR48_00985 [Sulfurimonas lithotrophica]|uniref:Uncharacterized protein n=1 Tax=Sulfurimonas lithotrophica TaxID=2590022 RepID=A0A5P8NY92_9BACT|nr:hypothetical protein [Sulfurimonas lithotrophica]QFR48374.1 hypothetical protein FJR48_00985 [Sulfurimonas lithotrophica]